MPNSQPIIGQLPVTGNTKSYKTLTFLPFEIEKSWSWFLHYEWQ